MVRRVNGQERKSPRGGVWQSCTRSQRLALADSPELRVRQLDLPGGGLVLPHPRRFGEGKGDHLARIRSFSPGEGVLQSLGFAVGSSLSDREATDRPFEDNPWVRAALKAKSRGFSRLKLQVWDGDPSDERSKPYESHPLLDLLASPNTLHTAKQFWRAVSIDYGHDGESVWFLADREGKPVATDGVRIAAMPEQIIRVRGGDVQVKADKAGMPTEWRYRVRKGWSAPWPNTAVIQLADYDPYNAIRGLGDVQAVMRQVDLIFQAQRHQDSSIRSGGTTGTTYIAYEERLGPDERDLRQQQFEDIQGDEGAGAIRVLDRKPTIVHTPGGLKLTEYPTLEAWLRDSILAALGVPGPVVNVFENATYDNVTTAFLQMWEGPNGILAFSEDVSDVLENRLLRRLQGLPGIEVDDRVHFSHEHIELLKKDRSGQIALAKEVSAAGIGVSFSEALEMQGVTVPAPEEGERRWVAGTLRDINDPPPAQTKPERAQVEVRALTIPDKGDPGLRKKARTWLDDYRDAQIEHLERIAHGKRDLSTPVEATDLSPEDIRLLELSEARWMTRMGKALGPTIKELFRTGAGKAAKEVGADLLKITDPRISRLLAGHNIALAEGATSYTAQRVRSAILRVLTKGADEKLPLRELVKRELPELTDELQRVFGNNEARASAISRTETGWATNNGRWEQFQTSKSVRFIEWRTAFDAAVRVTHQGLHGVQVPKGQRFSNGLRHPHDSAGAAGEIINCRCSFVPAFAD